VHLEDVKNRLIRVELQADSSLLMIEPTLLNPSDAFSIYVVTSGGEPTASVSARITGVSEIKSSSKKRVASRCEVAKWLFVFIAFCLSTVLFSITDKGVYHGHPLKQSIVFLPKRSFSLWL